MLSFPPLVAPTKVLIVPLSSNKEFAPFTRKLSQKLRAAGLSSRTDDSSATIGKRYSRNDEIGTPFGVTIDFQTIQDGTLTLRERDTTRQVRAEEDKIIDAILALVNGTKTWQDVEAELPKFEAQEIEMR